MFGYFLLFCAAALLVFLVLNPLLRLLKFFSLSQNVRAEGPQLHLKKQGTLTFGGLSFVLVIFILAVIFIDLDIYVSLWALLGLMLAFAWVGFADDFLKQVKKQNEGLTVINKFLLQCLFAFLFVFFVLWQQGNVALWRWFFYLPFAGLVIVGSSNAANLTDGLDGLLSGVAAIILLTLAAIAFKVGREEIALFSVMAAGAVAGFLSYNFYPAKIFMGDVGSLAIGALFGGLAVLLNREWWLLLVAAVPVVETLSVILQVAFYKLFKRRIFKMSPLHHHFELLGFSEVVVVWLFWGASLICGMLAYVLV